MVYLLLFLYVCMCAFPLHIYAIEMNKRELTIASMDLVEFMTWKRTGIFPIE